MTVASDQKLSADRRECPDYLHRRLLQDYALELFAEFERLSSSAKYALRGSRYRLAEIRSDQIKLVVAELALTLRRLCGDADE
jgi:hypothetical protein